MIALLSYYGNFTEKRYLVGDKFLCSPAQPQSRLDATSSQVKDFYQSYFHAHSYVLP